MRYLLGILVDVHSRSHGERMHLKIMVEVYLYPTSYKRQYHFRSDSTKQELKGAARSGRVDAEMLPKCCTTATRPCSTTCA